jgi:hypothetical protein
MAGGIPAAPVGDRPTVAEISNPIPTNRPEPDADGKPAADDKKPAPEFELVTLSHRELEWAVPKHRGQWDMNVQFEFEEGNRLRGFCVLLGGSPANISAVRNQIYRVCRTASEVDALLDDIAEQANKLCTG